MRLGFVVSWIAGMSARVDLGNSKGEGLGLAIEKRIVERHVGEISVESRWDEGTTFWFTLPAVQADEPRALARADFQVG